MYILLVRKLDEIRERWPWPFTFENLAIGESIFSNIVQNLIKE